MDPYEWLELVPLAQAELTVSISGIALLVFFLFLGGYIGYQRGVRSLLTLAIGTALAYLWCVRGGDVVFGTINRVISNLPRFAGIALNRDDWAATTWPAVIPTGIEALPWRIAFFLGIVIFSAIINKWPAWYGKAPAGHEPWAQFLGMFGGGLIALLWTTAAGVFYRIAEGGGTLIVGFLGNLLRAIPDLGELGTLIPMGLFFLALLAVVFVRTPMLVKQPPAPAKK